MLVRALLQTSLVLWLAQHTLQGGVKPHGVSWGKVLPARGLGLGVGVKPGVGALGALGSRHGSKAMKTGIGRYPGPQLGVGGYRSLGLGGRMKQGGYGAQGPYGASLGTGVPLGTGLTNGLGMGGGQAQKRAYGAGLGSLPGYGALPGNGYPGARPGVSAPELGGPELAGLGQAVPDPKREKSRVVVPPLYGKNYQTLGPEVPTGRGGGGGDLGPAAAAPELQAGGEAQNLGPSSLRPTIPLDKPIKNLGQPVLEGGENNEPVVLKRKTPPSRGAALAAGGVRQQLPPRRDDTRRPSSITDYGSPFHQNQPTPNCDREISRHELLGSETQRSPGLVPRPPLGKDGGHLGPERTNPLPLTHTQEVGGNVFSPPAGQGARNYVSAAEADRQGFTEPGPLTEVRGTGSHSPVEPQVPGRGRHGPVIPHTSVVLPSVEGQEAEGFTADSQT
ncbi:hypothetical protein INR49_030476 [Caranx melampygus]|nr:hypothetical protein INR49_030476 [Caranx melampygus]